LSWFGPGAIEMPETKIDEINDPVILEFIRLIGLMQEDEAKLNAERHIKALENQRLPRDVVLKVIDLLKMA
jgi:hypothetical protein